MCLVNRTTLAVFAAVTGLILIFRTATSPLSLVKRTGNDSRNFIRGAI